MKKIFILNTGGTFNKIYNPLNGKLEVAKNNDAIENILKYQNNLNYDIKTIIFFRKKNKKQSNCFNRGYGSF